MAETEHCTKFLYRPAPHIKWAVESGGTLIIDPVKGTSRILGYPQAALWDLMQKRYSAETMTNMLCAISSLSIEDTNNLIHESIKEWTEAGLLIREAIDG